MYIFYTNTLTTMYMYIIFYNITVMCVCVVCVVCVCVCVCPGRRVILLTKYRFYTKQGHFFYFEKSILISFTLTGTSLS